MRHSFKYDLGLDLYKEVVRIIEQRDDEAIKQFDNNKINVIKDVYYTYLDTSVNVQLLYLFLSRYKRLKKKVLQLDKVECIDYTETIGYSQLIAHKFSD
jgi:hypothetical protein